MKLIAPMITVMLLSLSMTGCATTEPTEKSLYDRLGGKPAITAVVEHLWSIASKDERINAYFAKTKPEVFAPAMIDFLCQGSGGPCQYNGRDMYSAHVGMNITGAAFDALAEDIIITLAYFKVPEQETGEVMSMLGGMKTAVIDH
jgi:hemoglobin